MMSNLTQAILHAKHDIIYHHDEKNSETHYSVQSVAPILWNLFPCPGDIYFKWLVCSNVQFTHLDLLTVFSVGRSLHFLTKILMLRVRTDFTLLHNGVEIGNGEIKPLETDMKLQEEDRSRIAEIMKKQLTNANYRHLEFSLRELISNCI
jgi:hypothetical protein